MFSVNGRPPALAVRRVGRHITATKVSSPMQVPSDGSNHPRYPVIPGATTPAHQIPSATDARRITLHAYNDRANVPHPSQGARNLAGLGNSSFVESLTTAQRKPEGR